MGHRRVNSDFMQRIRSYIDLRPSLFQEIVYEDCNPQIELIGQHAENGSYTWSSKCYDSESDNGQIVRKKSCNTAKNWTESCIFM